jgi:cytoskeleton protein RodZ
MSEGDIIQPVSAGQLLQQARQASGLHIAALSMALKVPVKKLEALEADDWAKLPDAVFVRTLATSVCRQLRTDPAPILAVLPQAVNPMILQDSKSIMGLNQSFRAPSDPKPSLLGTTISMPMLMAAIGLLLAALVIIFFPKSDDEAIDVKEEVAKVTTPILPLASTPNSALIVEPITPVASTPAQSSFPTLIMVAKGDVWVEVKDSRGTLLAQRTMHSGEKLTASGVPPLAVVIGRLNEMQSIEVRGKPMSLANLSPDNVARFEVK